VKIMFKKISIATSFMALMALTQCPIASANDVNDVINETNRLAEEIESQAQQPQASTSSYTQDEINNTNRLAEEIESQAQQPQASTSSYTQDEINNTNRLAEEIESQAQQPQASTSSYTQDEINNANELVREAASSAPQTQSGSSSSNFVSGAVRESNRIATEINQSNTDLMNRTQRTSSGSNGGDTSSYSASGSSQSQSGSILPIGAGLVIIGGICWVLNRKKIA
jgi:hypothetical protein